MTEQLRGRHSDPQPQQWTTQNIIVVSVTLSVSVTLGSGMAWLIYRICHADKTTTSPTVPVMEDEEADIPEEDEATEYTRMEVTPQDLVHDGGP